jgi:hypothetical protein
MAVLISKVARGSSTSKKDGLQDGSSHKTELDHRTSRVEISGGGKTQSPAHTFHVSRNDVEARGGSSGSQIPLSLVSDEHGIMKTVETMVLVERREDAQDRCM